MGDLSYVELGVAQTDAKAAEQRLSQPDGLSKQSDWSVAYLNERTIAMAIVFGLAVLTVVWLFPVPTVVSLGITGLVVLLAVAFIVLILKRRLALLSLRERHMKDCTSK